MSEPAPNETNRVYSEKPEFVELCLRAGVKPTRRQASKFRNKHGQAYRFTRKRK